MSDVRDETPPPDRAVHLTHPDKLSVPEAGISKAKLADYYRSAADRLLPHLAGRLVSLLRCPDGAGAECFFQRHPASGGSAALARMPVVEFGRGPR